MSETTRPERTSRGLPVSLLLAACCALLLVVVAVLVWPVWPWGFKDNSLPKSSPEKQGIPSAALQYTFRFTVPQGAKAASYAVVPGDGSAESGQDIYVRFRTNPAGVKSFVASMGQQPGDLAAGGELEQDDIDSVGLPWKINPKGHLVGLCADIPEKNDSTGTALVTIDETDAAAPMVYAHVTV
jgi:hypothetical protein